MATDKRERKRANRELKKAEEAKEQRKQHRISVIKRYAWYTALFSVALIALKVFFG